MTRPYRSSLGRIRAAGVAAMTCATLLVLIPAADALGLSKPWSSVTHAFVTCNTGDATPQICDPAYKHKVQVKSGAKVHVERLRYRAATSHCSPGRLLIYLDGKKIGATDFVQAGEDTTVEHLDQTLRHRANGKPHKFKYRMEGQVGGCNVGAVGSWAGDITLRGTKKS